MKVKVAVKSLVKYLRINSLQSEKGTALPSVLFLITILYIAAASVILYNHLQSVLVLREVDSVKADEAAQSGVALALASQTLGNSGTYQYTVADDANALVSVQPWGIYRMVKSEGQSANAHATKNALAGERLSGLFENALLFTNPIHQLILTGSSTIFCNVLTGPMGVSTGTLRDRATPRTLPVKGSLIKDSKLAAFAINKDQLAKEFEEYASALRPVVGTEHASTEFGSPTGAITLSQNMFDDSDEVGSFRGDVIVASPLVRREEPLTISTAGKVIFRPGSEVLGPVCFLSLQEIDLSPGVSLRSVILYSEKGIVVEPSAKVIGQLFSDSIVVKSGASLEYPSVVSNITGSKNGYLHIETGADVEGTVLSFSDNNPSTPALVLIDSGAAVTGAVYSEDRLTLDGIVNGIVIAKDFYFYESPTMYLGWIRSGKIDRPALPKSFLLPEGFSPSPEYEVLDWL